MSAEQSRQAIHETLGSLLPFGDGEDAPDGGVLVGWILVAEWQGTDGNRWLSKMTSDASGERELPTWHQRGYAYEALEQDWPISILEEEDDN